MLNRNELKHYGLIKEDPMETSIHGESYQPPPPLLERWKPAIIKYVPIAAIGGVAIAFALTFIKGCKTCSI